MRNLKAELFKTLAHPLRLRIIDALRAGPLLVGELCAQLQIDQPIASQHLAVLRLQNVVVGERSKATVRYSVSDPAIWQILDIARGICERQLSRMSIQVASGV